MTAVFNKNHNQRMIADLKRKETDVSTKEGQKSTLPIWQKFATKGLVAVARCQTLILRLSSKDCRIQKSNDDPQGTDLGPPPLQENQGPMTHWSHHRITNWKSLPQLHCKQIGLDLPDSPCDPMVATCQRARGREGHSLSWQHRDCLAPSPKARAV